MDDGFAYAWAPKAAVYGLGQLAIGIVVVRWLAHTARGDGRSSPSFDAWLVRFARTVSVLLIGGLILRLLAQTASAFGVDGAWAAGNLRLIALESRWGSGWRLQVLSAVGMLTAVLLPGRARWPVFGVCAVGLGLTMPALGHAAGSPARYAVHGVHNIGAAVWLGTLGVLTLAAWRSRMLPAGSIAGLVREFSPVALTMAAGVAATGVVAAWLYVGSWTALWTTPYGRVLSAKLLGVAIILACGWANWRDARTGSAPRRTIMTLEWFAAAVVLGITGVLTESEHP